MEGQEALMFYVAAPIIFFLFLIAGLVRGNRPMALSGVVCLGVWLLVVLGPMVDAGSLPEWSVPIWMKIVVGIVISVIAGAIVKLFFGR